ncbi:nitrogen regulation protein [bacterium BMS3Abin11]|nr:nitrogen regulation protein [bacterium BMS3Abin11]GMT39930.1 MAG: sigma-54-dependent Fis family transcriptional regulator [bacterium]HDZ78912.1 sigma-54-dependent Fis family transcriptional regulator [Gammaproteobacteria bacterium]
MNNKRILITDDEPEICRLVQEILEDEGFNIATAFNAEQARKVLRDFKPDLVLLDIWMPGTDGISLLKEWMDGEDIPPAVVMMSGHGNVETAVEAIRYGAYDFLEKPLSMAKLMVTVQRALQNVQLRNENVQLRQQLQPLNEPIGDSSSMQELREQIKLVANTESWVLVTGEPGSGKEIAARMIHKLSPRAEAELVTINLAAIPAENIAVQMFGSEKDGLVTAGSFEQAKGGTLLLDEIADMDLGTQAKLIGALRENRFLRVGGNTPVELDVRVIAATTHNLEEEVTAGHFREDLYYRLNVVPIQIPPLREHPEDVSMLIEYYLDYMTRVEHLPARQFSTPSLGILRQYSWPGNVRELKNLIQRLLILKRGVEVTVEEVQSALGKRTVAEVSSEPAPDYNQSLREARDQFERSYLLHHLKQVGGNVSELAQIVGMERTHLYRKLKALDINPKNSRRT